MQNGMNTEQAQINSVSREAAKSAANTAGSTNVSRTARTAIKSSQRSARRKGSIWEEWSQLKPTNFLFLTIAGLINSIGVTIFLAPVNLYDSGISGTSMLLAQISPEWLSLSLFLIILNIKTIQIG